MIAVTNVEVMEVNGKKVEIDHLPSFDIIPNPRLGTQECVYQTEMIIGKQFINHEGKTVYIGMSKKVQETIGLSFEAFEKLRSERDKLKDENGNIRAEIGYLKKKVKKYETMNFWQKLQFLFTGRI